MANVRFRRVLAAFGAVAVLIVGLPARAASPDSAPAIHRAYVDMRYGQLHYRIAVPPKGTKLKIPLVMLHQSPLSSLEFGPLIAEMAKDRVTIAIDTPGQGQSDGPKDVPSIEDYALAIDEALKTLGYGPNHPIEILGNHTGTFIAAELAIMEPKMVRKMALIGVYVVPEERRLKAVARLDMPTSSAEFFDHFCALMPVMKKYYDGQGRQDADWGPMLADSIRPLVRREYGHQAAYAYAEKVRERLPLVTQPVVLMAVDDGIGQPTKDSQPFFKHATLLDLPQFPEGAFYTHTAEIAAILRQQLD
jgi:pimeloyl-ACP methyl ester carboxylesterase